MAENKNSPLANNAENLALDVSTELHRFQDGLQFINAVRTDLANQKQADTLDDAPATVVANETVQADRVAGRVPSKHPAVIGRFDIRSVVGEGGFATVYLAFDPVLNRDVAVKVLKTGHQHNQEATGRFEREARISAVLSHPNIVPVFDAGISNEQPYIVSKFCEGISLEQWAEDNAGQITSEVAVRIVATIASAIEYAHQRGVVHRDLKPGNVLIDSGTDSSDSIDLKLLPDLLRITDFGLAKFDKDVDQLQTVEGVIIGTPAYMSPEQAYGGEITFASDIYSIGVMLYKLLTCELPLQGETHLQTIYSITHNQPQPPSSKNAAVHRDLDAIVLKCLQKQPEHRYATAYELADDLQRWLRGRPVSARLATAPERLIKWCQRNPVLSFAMAMAAAALAFALVQLNSANENYEKAQWENQKAERNVDLAQDTIEEMVSKIAPSSSIPTNLRQELVTRAVTLQEQLLADAPDNRQIVYQTAESYVALSVLHDNLREFGAALEAVQRAEEILDGFSPRAGDINEHQTFTRIRLQKSDLLILLERHEEATQLLGMTDFDSATREQRANKLQFESRALLKDGKLQESWNTATEARLIYESNRGNIFARGGVAGILFDIGLIEMEMGKLADAENTFILSTEVYDEVGSMIPYHETFACGAGLAHMNLGDIRLRLGKLQMSVDSLNRANEIFSVILEGNQIRDVYQEYAVNVELLRYDAFMESDSVISASESVKRAQALFMDLPASKSAEGVSFDKTKKTNRWKLERSIEILLNQIRVAESVEPSVVTDHVEQAKEILAYIELNFSNTGKELQDAVKRLHLLQK